HPRPPPPRGGGEGGGGGPIPGRPPALALGLTPRLQHEHPAPPLGRTRHLERRRRAVDLPAPAARPARLTRWVGALSLSRQRATTAPAATPPRWRRSSFCRSRRRWCSHPSAASCCNTARSSSPA